MLIETRNCFLPSIPNPNIEYQLASSQTLPTPPILVLGLGLETHADCNVEDPTPPTLPHVAPDGDIILVLGPDRVHLRVASHCLRSASMVFNAMFGPDWSEGQDLSPESPKHIDLEEDDPEAMHSACLVLHHNNNAKPRVPKPWGVLQVAILADKYRLNVALKYAATFWLNSRGDGMSMMDRMYLLAAAFPASDDFTRLTRELVLGHKGSFLGLIGHQTVLDVLPLKTFRA